MTTKWGLPLLVAVVVVTTWGCGGHDRSGGDPGDAGATDQDAMVFRRDGGGDDSGGPAGCQVGEPCLGGQCPSGLACQAQIDFQIGGAADPITDNPAGPDSPIPGAIFSGGYCTPAAAQPVQPSGCNPDDENSCGSCATCIIVDQTDDGMFVTMCLRECQPSWTESSCPGTGNACDFGIGICFPGCTKDDDCRVERRDTNASGEIDPYHPTDNPDGDHLVYDASHGERCNPTTFRCEHDGTEGATAGITCAQDTDCEANGYCITDEDWPDGYCSKDGCDKPGGACAVDGVCQDRLLRSPQCAQGCTVGAEAEELRLGPTGHGEGCRPGYLCGWNGQMFAGTEFNGGCFPGNYNAVTEPNIGADCTEDSECYSPFGMGDCMPPNWLGYCSLLDCSAPGLPEDVCGPGATCSLLVDDLATCLKDCTTAAECSPGDACVQFNGAGFGKSCLPFCDPTVMGECREGEQCRNDDAGVPRCLPPA